MASAVLSRVLPNNRVRIVLRGETDRPVTHGWLTIRSGVLKVVNRNSSGLEEGRCFAISDRDSRGYAFHCGGKVQVDLELYLTSETPLDTCPPPLGYHNLDLYTDDGSLIVTVVDPTNSPYPLETAPVFIP